MSVALYDGLERVVKLLRQFPDLAEVSSVSMTDDGLWVNPWIFGAPMTALVSWHEILADVTCEVEVLSHDRSLGDFKRVIVRGTLDDVVIIAQGFTFNDLQYTDGWCSEAELRKLANMEEPF